MSNKKIAYGILAIAVAANVALAVGFKLYFFKPPQLIPVVPNIADLSQPVIPGILSVN